MLNASVAPLVSAPHKPCARSGFNSRLYIQQILKSHEVSKLFSPSIEQYALHMWQNKSGLPGPFASVQLVSVVLTDAAWTTSYW